MVFVLAQLELDVGAGPAGDGGALLQLPLRARALGVRAVCGYVVRLLHGRLGRRRREGAGNLLCHWMTCN